MIRSSQATDLYNNLAQNNAGQIGNFANELLANSQENTAKMLTNLMLLYMNGYNAMSDTQKQSLATSQGNATNNSSTIEQDNLASQMMQMALQAAMSSLGSM